MSDHTYSSYKKAISGIGLPAAFIDLDLLDANIDALLKRSGSTAIRIASKSIRSVGVLKYIQDKSAQFNGFMAFTLDEAVHLSKSGLNDILLGYPSLQLPKLEGVAEEVNAGKKIVLMVDKVEHLNVANRAGELKGCTLEVCIDIDCSTKHMGIYFGVHRSSIKTPDSLRLLLEEAKKFANIKVVGMMGYEAQIAGVADNQAKQGLKNGVIRKLKRKSIPQIAKRRGAMQEVYQQVLGESPELFNAGGTGSIESSIAEDWVTEVTAGSGFFSPRLFDDYVGFRHLPAAFYAVEIVRQPDENMYTAHGGGYTASGGVGPDKAPQPYLPIGMKLTKNEGVGEVQTPFEYKGKLTLGDPVFFRHAKAGELSERFNALNLIKNTKVVGTYNTYRGEGKCFL